MRRFGGGIVALFLITFAWFSASYIFKVPHVFLPTPLDTFIELLALIVTGEFWLDLGHSFFRVFMAFLLSFAVAYPIVNLALVNNQIRQGVFVLTEFFRYLPVPVFIPITILWFGIEDTSKIAIVFLGTFVQMIPMFYDSSQQMEKSYDSFRVALKWNSYKFIRNIVIPGSAPLIMDNARICLGWAWTYLIIAELMGADHGLGYAIIRAQRYLATDKIFAYVIVIGIIGIITDQIMKFSRKYFFKWY